LRFAIVTGQKGQKNKITRGGKGCLVSNPKRPRTEPKKRGYQGSGVGGKAVQGGEGKQTHEPGRGGWVLHVIVSLPRGTPICKGSKKGSIAKTQRKVGSG